MSEVVVVKENQAIEVPKNQNYITNVLKKIKNDFIEINDGLDFDFVTLGTWLYVSKKGNFITKDSNGDPLVDFGDTLDVVIGKGEQRWMLWGGEKTPEANILIAAKRDKEEAIIDLENFLNEHPDARERYDANSLKFCYIAYLVPVMTLSSNEDIPDIYLMNFSTTNSYAWGNYAKNTYLGQFKQFGIPTRTAVNRIVTRMTTEEKSNGNNSWIGLKFDPVGIFNPNDYNVANMAKSQSTEEPY